MRVAEKMDAISRIGRELQDRYSYTEIDVYLSAFGIEPPQSPTGSWNSNWVYSKAALSRVPINTIAQITEDLELGSVAAVVASQSPPKIWDGTTDF